MNTTKIEDINAKVVDVGRIADTTRVAVTTSHASLSELRDDITTIRHTVAQSHGLAETSTPILNGIATAITEVARTVESTGSLVEVSVRHTHPGVTMKQFNDFRNEILSLITDQQPSHGPHQSALRPEYPVAPRFSPEENKHFSARIRNDILQSHSTLKDACDFLKKEKMPDCRCTLVSRKSVRYSRLSYLSESIGYHNSSCPFRQTGRRSWRYQVSIQLLPFIARTVELVLGGSEHGTKSTLEYPLKVVCTVPRFESVMFRLFDEFSTIARPCWNKKRNESHFVWEVVKEDEETHHCYGLEWDIMEVRDGLRHLNKCLRKILENGQGSLHDRDECGHTILHVSERWNTFKAS